MKSMNSSSSITKKQLVLLGVSLTLLVFVVLEVTNVTHVLHSKPQEVTAGQATKGEAVSERKSATENSIKASNQSAATNDKADPGSQSSLVAPSGNFVSAHNVPSSASIASVCNTTYGATCVISFRSNNVIRSLNAKLADKGGTAYWDSWTPETIGLSTGDWQISATATLNGKSISSTDAMLLRVTQ